MTAEISRDHNPLRDPDDRRLNRIAGPSALVIFGVTGDLSRKKLMPAVYDLANRGLLPPGFALVGFARRDWEDQDFAVVHDAVRQYARTPFREETWKQLLQGIRFVSGEFGDDDAFRRLRETVEKLDVERGTMGNHAFYLSIPPRDFPIVAKQLKASGLVDDKSNNPDAWRRVVIEKPFGSDLQTARELNATLEVAFPADSIFRIDHYLGKETVQNILALRFANELYEPIWNANYVDHVQITMAEDIGVGGARLLRRHRRGARRHPEPPSPAARADRDGGAHLDGREGPARREGEGPRRGTPARRPVHGHGARPVRRRLAGRREGHGLPRRGRHEPGLDDRDVRRREARDRDAPLGGRAVLPAHGQAWAAA
jgi:hypothetical protein